MTTTARYSPCRRRLPRVLAWLPAVALALLMVGDPAASHAAGLKAYKKQKHKKRKAPVTDRSCPAAYVARCMTGCTGNKVVCEAACRKNAGPFCAKRKQKRHRETSKLALKGASLGAGLLLTGLTAVPWTCERVTKQGKGEMAVPWDRPSVIGMVGGGVINDDWQQLVKSKTYLATATMRLRLRFLGVSAMYSRLMEGSDHLDELDFGPTFYFASSYVSFGIQPSILVSSGAGVDTMYGKGLRTWTRGYFGPLVGVLDTMLGKINGQWNYHGRIGAGMRLTPRFFAIFAVDFRDIVDLTDLDISSASLQGVMLAIGGRYN